MSFKIVRNDITKMNTEAIVNTANEKASAAEGEAFLTPGPGLAAKYIIHTVSPRSIDGKSGEEAKLRACYRNSLSLAKENGIKEIAVPLISTEGFGYPREVGMRIAIDEINAFLSSNEMSIILVVLDSKSTASGEPFYPDLEAYIDQNYVHDKKEEEYKNALCDALLPLNARVGIQHEWSERKSECCFEKLSDDWEFGETHESKLEERMNHISDTFSQYLLFLIQSKGMENAAVYKRAIVDKKIFSKIKNNAEYHPQKLTALCLCMGAMLNLDETRDLLARAGYALSPCDKTDIIFSYFIENQIYDMIELDIQLEEHGLPCIIS